MSQLFSALKTTFSSFSAINTAINTVGDNIANANNANYNRRVEVYEDVRFGGVSVTEVIRLTADGIQRDFVDQINVNGADEVMRGIYEQLEQLTGGGLSETYLTDYVQGFSDAWKAFEASPENYAAEQEVIEMAYNIVQELERLSWGADQIEFQLQQDVVDLVEKVNVLTTEINELNQQIVRDKMRGLSVSDYQNNLDKRIEELAEIIEVRTFTRDNGSVAVYTGAGLSLVDQSAATLYWDYNDMSLTLSNQQGNLVNSSLMPRGSLGTSIDLLRKDSEALRVTDYKSAPIQKFRNQLDELAYSFVDDATAALQSDYTLDFDDIMTDIPGLEVGESFVIQTTYEETSYVLDDDGLPTDEVLSVAQLTGTSHEIVITENMTVQDVVDYINNNLTYADGEPELRARITGTGTIEIATTADNVVNIAMADGITHEDGAIIDNTGRVLMNAAGEIQVTGLNTDANGDLYLDGVRIESSTVENSRGALAAIGFTMDADNVSAEKRDPPTFANAYNNAERQDGEGAFFFEAENGDTPLGASRVSLQINQEIYSGRESLKDLSGNAVVEALNYNGRKLIGSGGKIENMDYTGLTSYILTDISSRAAHATVTADTSRQIRETLHTELRDKVGVDLDEEMMRLTILENSYAATARALDTIQKMFDALEAAV